MIYFYSWFYYLCEQIDIRMHDFARVQVRVRARHIERPEHTARLQSHSHIKITAIRFENKSKDFSKFNYLAVKTLIKC